MQSKSDTTNYQELKNDIRQWGIDLGFQQIGVSDIDLSQAEERLAEWLAMKFHGTMAYMHQHGSKRSQPAELVPGTVRVISARMDYLPESQEAAKQLLDHDTRAYISRYALGRDYHKVLRGRLRSLARRISERVGDFGYRVFVDSAPVLEKALAEKAGLGWIGKDTMLINPQAGSWFLLGEIYTDLPLPIDKPQENTHCGSCTRCLEDCPTGAIVAPNQVDARRCISYLTIENRGAIPRELRPLMMDWIFGCDICQEVCPVNRKAVPTKEPAFQRGDLATLDLLELLSLTEEEFLERFAGTPIMRAKLVGLKRNACVALGNRREPSAIPALSQSLRREGALVRGHAAWALGQIGGEEARQALQQASAAERNEEVSEEINGALAEFESLASG